MTAPTNYYLFVLLFTIAYVSVFWLFLRRFDEGDPKIGAFKRVLLGVAGWALFDFLVVRLFQYHGARAAVAAFPWLSILFLLFPPASFELILALLGRAGKRERLLVYGPYALLYAAALLFPGQVGGGTYSIPNPGPEHGELWNQAFRGITFCAAIVLFPWLLIGALRQQDKERRNEMLILFAGGALTGLGNVAARLLMDLRGPGFPFTGSLWMVFTCLAAFWGARHYGRVLSPRILYKAILKSSPNGMMRIGQGNILWTNEAMARMLGAEGEQNPSNAPLPELFDPRAHPEAEREEIARLLAEGLAVNLEVALARCYGEPLWCLVSSVLLDPRAPRQGALAVFADISARKREEGQRLLSEKLKAAMETAGAVCHEMNQPLQVLSARLELMQLHGADQESLGEKLEDLKRQVERLGEITRRLIELTHYRTKAYSEDREILDLECSAPDAPRTFS